MKITIDLYPTSWHIPLSFSLRFCNHVTAWKWQLIFIQHFDILLCLFSLRSEHQHAEDRTCGQLYFTSCNFAYGNPEALLFIKDLTMPISTIIITATEALKLPLFELQLLIWYCFRAFSVCAWNARVLGLDNKFCPWLQNSHNSPLTLRFKN